VPTGFQNSATGLDLGLLHGLLVFVEETAEDGPAFDPLLGEAGDGVVGPGRAEFAAALGALSVVAAGDIWRGPTAGAVHRGSASGR